MSTDPSIPDDQTLLNALRGTGLRLVQSIDASLDADRTPDELAALAATYERTGRGVRRTIAFCRHLAQAAADPVAKRAADRRRIIRTVEDAIERSAAPGNAENLRAEFYERLDSPEFAEELEHFTPEQAAEHVLRDFGLGNPDFAAPYPRRTPSDIAILSARAAGRPLPKSDTPPTVESILAWDARRRRPNPLAP